MRQLLDAIYIIGIGSSTLIIVSDLIQHTIYDWIRLTFYDLIWLTISDLIWLIIYDSIELLVRVFIFDSIHIIWFPVQLSFRDPHIVQSVLQTIQQ